MARSSRTIWLAACAAGTAALLTGAALALGRDVHVAVRPDPAPPVQTVPREVAEQMSAFRRAQGQSDRMPGDPAADLQAVGDRQPGENPALARRFKTGRSQDAYAWPMAGGVCYASPGPAGCVPMELLRRRGATIATSSTGDSPIVQVFGLAADSVKTVQLDFHDGRTVTVDVHDGAFYLELTADPVRARWTMADGSQQTQAPLVIR